MTTLTLTLPDLRSSSRYLFVTKAAALAAVPGIDGVVQSARRIYEKIEALPPEVLGLLNVDELKALDGVHDGWGMGVWYACQATLSAPTASAELKRTAQWTLTNFIPEKRELQATFVKEATRARDREPTLAEGRAQLEAVPMTDGRTLYAWVHDFLEAGKGLDPLLQGRAEGQVDRSEAGKLRGLLIGRLAKLREAIADVLEETPDGGAAVLQGLFGYYDLLADMRSKNSKEPTPPPPAA
jgi:hypothetical protein